MTTSQYKSSIRGKRCAVLGLGVSNTPLVDFLLDAGAIVTVRDAKSREELGDTAALLAERGVNLVCGQAYLDNIDEEIIFRSPGIHPDHAGIRTAVANGAILTSEMELFMQLCPAKMIGITGSDGKTTTTTIIHKMLVAAGLTAHVGGNIGTPLLPIIEQIQPSDFVVLELSSFQLQTMTQSPDIALVTNMSPNHLDWHDGMGDYIDAKRNIFAHQKNGCRLILNRDNDVTSKFRANSGVATTWFSRKEELSEGGCVRDGVILHNGEEIMPISDILLPGAHNLENYLAAIAVVRPFVEKCGIINVAKSFGGVEHRLEIARRLHGVTYINSSIDSSPSRTAAALSALSVKPIIICGGYDKNLAFEPLAESLVERAKLVILTGATADAIKSAFDAHPAAEKPQVIMQPDFTDAVLAASNAASEDDIVLLSPACASFDSFANFMERGDRFKEIVNSL